MTEQEVINNAPCDDWTHIGNNNTYLKITFKDIYAFYGDRNECAVNSATLHDLQYIRSRQDIERIIKLQAENQELKQDKMLASYIMMFGGTDDKIGKLKEDFRNYKNKVKADAIREAVDNLTFDGLGTIKKLLYYADKLEQSE